MKVQEMVRLIRLAEHKGLIAPVRNAQGLAEDILRAASLRENRERQEREAYLQAKRGR